MTTTAHDSLDPRLSDIDFDALNTQMQDAPGFPHFCLDGFLDASRPATSAGTA